MQLSQNLLSKLNNPQIFCEVGVYYYDEYCRLKKQIEDGFPVILVEPAPPCVEDILKNVEGKANVAVFPLAIADEDGETDIHFEGASAFINEIDGKAPCHQRNYLRPGYPIYKVKKVKFDSIDPGNIDVLLIDTEGMEYFVLKNLVSRPQLIIVETHFREYTNPYIQEIERWMAENGYKLEEKDEADSLYLKQ